MAKAGNIADFTPKVIIEDEKDTVVNFKPKLITGGKEPPDGTFNGNWLRGMEEGTEFFVSNKNNRRDPILGLFRIVYHTAKSTVLTSPSVPGQPIPVIPERWCTQYDLHEVLGVVREDSASPFHESTTSGMEDSPKVP